MSIFGTDGVRGPAGKGVLAPQELLRLGVAFGRACGPGRVLIARDTRASGPMMVAALAAGMLAAGCDVEDLGELPTPALAWLLASCEAVGGVMVTASHNPWQDNGVKLFAGDGSKCSDVLQAACEGVYLAAVAAGNPGPSAERPGTLSDGHIEARGAYLGSLTSGRRGVFSGRTVVVDHAAGAAWQVLGVALRSMGASVVSAAPRPDGVNINEGVGAVHPEAAAARCVELGAWAGLCVDGDGDRIMIIDETGAVHDGDAIVGFLAARMHEAGTLQGGEVVGTITTGMGLQAFLAERGIALHRTAVGDRHIAARLRQTGGNLGGESSGHVLTPDLCPSGDGSRVGIEVLALAATGDAALSELLGAVPRYPTGHRKVPVVAKPPLTELASLRAVLAAADAELAGCGGRQLLRYSGTEAILRVLVEGRDDALVQRWADRLADAAKNAIAEHGES